MWPQNYWNINILTRTSSEFKHSSFEFIWCVFGATLVYVQKLQRDILCEFIKNILRRIVDWKLWRRLNEDEKQGGNILSSDKQTDCDTV